MFDKSVLGEQQMLEKTETEAMTFYGRDEGEGDESERLGDLVTSERGASDDMFSPRGKSGYGAGRIIRHQNDDRDQISKSSQSRARKLSNNLTEK
jgi:hypothetical protein